MSGNHYELEQTMDVLVLVKAYPQPSTKYVESVCVAGLRVDTPEPSWCGPPGAVPVLARERQFTKYNVSGAA